MEITFPRQLVTSLASLLSFRMLLEYKVLFVSCLSEREMDHLVVCAAIDAVATTRRDCYFGELNVTLASTYDRITNSFVTPSHQKESPFRSIDTRVH